MFDRIAKPMAIRIMMIIDCVFIALTSYLVIYILKGLRNVTSIDSLRPFFEVFKQLPFLVILLLIYTLIIAILGIYRAMRVRQDTFSLINGLTSLVFIALFIFERDFFQKVANITTGDDIYALKDTFNDSGTVVFRLLFVLSIVLIIYNIVVLLMAKKIIHANVFVPDHIANSREVKIGDVTYTNTQIMGEETRMYVNAPRVHFFRTANGLAVIMIALAVAIAFVGYTAYDQLVVCDPVDLGKNISIQVNMNVDSGQGTILKSQILNHVDYYGKNKKARIYIKNLISNRDNYTISKSKHLKNGDKVTITLNYDKQRCEDLHIRVTNNQYTQTLNGYIREFKNGAEIGENKKLYNAMINSGDALLKTQLAENTTYSFDSAYLCKCKKDPDYILLLYKIIQNGSTYYGCVYTNQNVTTDYLSKSHVYIGPNVLRKKPTNAMITTSSEARAIMKKGIAIGNDSSQTTSMIVKAKDAP